MTTRLTAPNGAKVQVDDSKVAGLRQRGFTLSEPPAERSEAPAKKTAKKAPAKRSTSSRKTAK